MDLFFEVVDLRIRRSATWVKDGRVSDDELYDCVWESTLRLIIEIEEMCLGSGRDSLKIRIPDGILRSGTVKGVHELTE